MSTGTPINDGGPAFPGEGGQSGYGASKAVYSPNGECSYIELNQGMSLRAYAALQLRQPSSGIPWLDEMIMSAKRDEIAMSALTGELASASTEESAGAIAEAAAKAGREVEAQIAFNCYNVADAMLKAREVQP